MKWVKGEYGSKFDPLPKVTIGFPYENERGLKICWFGAAWYPTLNTGDGLNGL